MAKITINGEYFSVKDTLECGQVFRFAPFKNGYKVFTVDKCAYCYNQGEFAVIECNDEDKTYFEEYFDLCKEYSKIYQSAIDEKVKILSDSAKAGRGIRILKQDAEETLFSFIISQNNNIPRIKKIIERLCTELGKEKEFMGEKYYSFPTAQVLASQDEDFYKSVGLGYRASYVKSVAKKISDGYNVKSLSALKTIELKKELLTLHGVGPKVADCVSLFGYAKSDSFPVDTWIDKVYREDFGGKLNNRDKISNWFVQRFKENSGYYQQYLFFYKRELESKNNGQKDN